MCTTHELHATVVARRTMATIRLRMCEIYVDASIRTAGYESQLPQTQHTPSVTRYSGHDDAEETMGSDNDALHKRISLFGCGIGIHFSGKPDKDVCYRVNTLRPTSTRMEMLAIRTALLLAYGQSRVIIYTDSQHCVMLLSTHVDQYVRTNWLNAKMNACVAESDVARQCMTVINARARVGQVTKITKVAGHNGVVGNVIADKLAGKASTGIFNGIITDDVTYSNGVAVSTRTTYDVLIEAAKQIKVDIARTLPGIITIHYPRQTLDLHIEGQRVSTLVMAPKSNKAMRMASVGWGFEDKTPPDEFDPSYIVTPDISTAVHECHDEEPDINVSVTEAETERLKHCTRWLFLTCASCLDTIAVKHKNFKLANGLESAFGLTHCRMCIKDMSVTDPNIDTTLKIAIEKSRINPLLLHGSRVYTAAATIAGQDPTVLCTGAYVTYTSCKHLLLKLTRSDEICGVNVIDSTVETLRGGFF